MRIPIEDTKGCLSILTGLSGEPCPDSYQDRRAWVEKALVAMGVPLPTSVHAEEINSTLVRAADSAPSKRLAPVVVGQPPKFFGHADGADRLSPAIDFYEIPGGSFVSLGGLGLVILAQNGQEIEDLSSPFAPLLSLAEHLPNVILNTTCVLNADRFYQANYAHWLLDGIPRLLGTHSLRSDHVVAHPAAGSRWQTSFNSFFMSGHGLPIDPFTIYSCKMLRCTTYGGRLVPHPAYKAHPVALNFIKDFAQSRQGNDSLLVFPRLAIVLVRRESRSVHGVNLVVDALSKDGSNVLILDPTLLDLSMQYRLFSTADLVFGVHGAGLASSVFMKPGATLIEVIPEEFGNPAFWMVASQCDLNYIAVPAPSFPEAKRPQSRDVRIEPEIVEEIMDHVREIR